MLDDAFVLLAPRFVRNLEHPKRTQFYNRQRYHDNYRPQYRPREAFQNIYPQVLPHPSGMPRMSRYAERYPRGPEYLNYPPSDYSHSPTGPLVVRTFHGAGAYHPLYGNPYGFDNFNHPYGNAYLVEQPPSLQWRRPSATIQEVNPATSPSPRKPESNSKAQLREILNKTNATDTNKVDKKTNTFLTSESKRSENKEGNTALGSENKSGKDGDNTVRKLLIQQSEHKDNAPNIDLNYMDLEELRKRAERVAQRKK